jgi:iron complex outermembrane receptor protein
VAFVSRDGYLADGNDGSGSAEYRDTSPVAGVLWRWRPTVHFYANLGYGFETPTFTEMSYRPGNLPGLNFGLKPSRSRSMEAGVKARPWPGALVDVALFRVESDDEIVVDGSSGGRTTYRNGGRTLREGLELSFTTPLGGDWETMAACSWLGAQYRDRFGTTPAGNYLPAVPSRSCHGELAWRPAGGFSAALEGHHLSAMYVDDANSATTPAYTIASLRAGWRQQLRGWEFQEFLRIDNLADRRYIGSLIVNERNGRFYEPAPGRSYLLGVAAAYRF